jgi:hypothetical protein
VEPRDEQLLGLAPKVLHEAALSETGLSPREIAMVAGLVRKLRDQGLADGPGWVVEVVDQDRPGDGPGGRAVGASGL